MSLIAFLSAVFSLLLAPGPTNTLIGIAGAQGGPRKVAQLMPFELAGYLCAILPLTVFGAPLVAAWPEATVALKIVAALWVLWLAIRLWGIRGAKDADSNVTRRRIFTTTLLNPKALIFALVLLPSPPDPEFLPRLGMFCLALVLVAMLWGTAGHLARTGGRGHQGGDSRLWLLQRAASLWLGVVSATLIASAFST